MAEYTAVAIQLVEENRNVQFSDTAVKGSPCIVHRNGSGIVTLRGLTQNQYFARFRVSFGGNIAVPADGTVGEISVALSIDGEALGSAEAIVTPAAVDEYFNVFVSVFVDVPKGCCVTIAVTNTSDQAINVQNANLIIERVA